MEFKLVKKSELVIIPRTRPGEFDHMLDALRNDPSQSAFFEIADEKEMPNKRSCIRTNLYSREKRNLIRKNEFVLLRVEGGLSLSYRSPVDMHVLDRDSSGRVPKKRGRPRKVAVLAGNPLDEISIGCDVCGNEHPESQIQTCQCGIRIGRNCVRRHERDCAI